MSKPDAYAFYHIAVGYDPEEHPGQYAAYLCCTSDYTAKKPRMIAKGISTEGRLVEAYQQLLNTVADLLATREEQLWNLDGNVRHYEKYSIDLAFTT